MPLTPTTLLSSLKFLGAHPITLHKSTRCQVECAVACQPPRVSKFFLPNTSNVRAYEGALRTVRARGVTLARLA